MDVDLRKFFDTIDHGHLREFLKRRVRDGVILRLIGKWLNAGVLEEGILTIPDDGTPQGGVVSPLLANIFLHYVLDEWFEKEVGPRLQGEAFVIRYADDFVIGVAREDDAQRIMEVLPKRMSKYGLTVHPEKTRLVRFEPPQADDSETEERDPPEPRTFDFLGFTHYWGRSQRGAWVVKRKTAKSRFKRALSALSDWCRANLHLPIKEQHQKLSDGKRRWVVVACVTGFDDPNFSARSLTLFLIRNALHAELAEGLPVILLRHVLHRLPVASVAGRRHDVGDQPGLLRGLLPVDAVARSIPLGRTELAPLGPVPRAICPVAISFAAGSAARLGTACPPLRRLNAGAARPVTAAAPGPLRIVLGFLFLLVSGACVIVLVRPVAICGGAG